MEYSEFGRVVRVDLKSCWVNEPDGFTPWLARPENIKALGNALDFPLDVADPEAGTEVPVGAFSADIVCRNGDDGSTVVIENQLTPTDHTHLGQCLTYAAGLGASTVVWIAKELRAEHVIALDWLNDALNGRVRLFGVVIEVWRIGDSPPAPMFRVVVRPSSLPPPLLTETRELQLQYWRAFRDHAKKCGSDKFTPTKPYPANYMNMAFGRAGFSFGVACSPWNLMEAKDHEGQLRAELYMSEAEKHFGQLHADRQIIESKLKDGEELLWRNPDDVKNARVFFVADGRLEDRSDWPRQHEWFCVHLDRLHDLFYERVMELE